jgi:translocation and assembly module TamA
MFLRGLIFVACCFAAVAPRPGWSDVTIDGVDGALDDNARAFLGLLDLTCESPAWLVRWQFGAVEKDVAQALEALGYYDSQVTKSLEFPTEGCWQARIQIKPGKPVIVRQVTVEIKGPLANEPGLAASLQSAKAMQREPLSHATYESIKRALMDASQRLGYFDALLVRNEVEVKVDTRSAIVTIVIDGGDRYRFGTITVTQDVLARRLVDAYFPFHEGDYYSSDLVARLRRNLTDSGYFAQAVVLADPDSSLDHRVPVNVTLTPPNRDWVYSLGLGYATDTGPRLRADADNRAVNMQGHRAKAGILLSQVRTTLDAEYRIPHRNPMNDWISFDAGIAREDTDSSNSDVMKIGARHTYPRWGWVEVDFVELAIEDFRIADKTNESRLLLTGSTLSRVWRDDPVRPTRGLRLSATVRGAAQSLASDTSFVQMLTGAKAVHALTDSTRVLARIDGGWTWKEEFSDLPPSVRFFAGGDSSIRGYEYQSIGPESDGQVVGGSGLLTGSVELDWSFRPGWSAAAFVDSGSAFDRVPELVTGVGMGLRWYSPLGPIRVDLAHPLDDDKSGIRLHVSIGPDL